MRIIFDVCHPAQVHFYKNAINILQQRGHEIIVSARDKEVLIPLLESNNISYSKISSQKKGFFGLSYELFHRVLNLHRLIKQFKPDLICGPGETVAIAGKLTKVPTIIFNDSEPVPLNKILTYPFVNVICTPSTFKNDLGEKQVRFNGYKEVAYLHPKYFQPDPSIFQKLGLEDGEIYILIRFVSWNAAHDFGQHGLRNKLKIVKELEKHGRVFISSEDQLSEEFASYKLNIAPENLHDALYYAKLLFCDSQTMTSEAGILGTPAIRCNSFVGTNDMGNFVELEKVYRLIYNFSNEDFALSKSIELLQISNLKGIWAEKREKFLNDKIDVTTFLVWFIENYPLSVKEMKEHPDVQYSCASALYDTL